MLSEKVIALQIDITKEIISLKNFEKQVNHLKTQMISQDFNIFVAQLKNLNNELSHLETDFILYATEASSKDYSARFEAIREQHVIVEKAIKQQLALEAGKLKIAGKMEIKRLHALNLPKIKIQAYSDPEDIDLKSQEVRYLPSDLIKYLFDWQAISHYQSKDLQSAHTALPLSDMIDKGLKLCDKFHQREAILQRLIRAGQDEIAVTDQTKAHIALETNTLDHAVENAFESDADIFQEDPLTQVDKGDSKSQCDVPSVFTETLDDSDLGIEELSSPKGSDAPSHNLSLSTGTTSQPKKILELVEAADAEDECWDDEMNDELEAIRQKFGNGKGKGSVRMLKALAQQDADVRTSLQDMGLDFFSAPDEEASEKVLKEGDCKSSKEKAETSLPLASESEADQEFVTFVVSDRAKGLRRSSLSFEASDLCSSAPNTPRGTQEGNPLLNVTPPGLFATLSLPTTKVRNHG